MLGKLPVPGRPTNSDSSRARASCACRRCGWGLCGHFFSSIIALFFLLPLGMVLGKLPVPGRPTILMTVGQGLIVLAVGAGGGWFGHFYSPLSSLSSFSLSLGDGLI